MSKAIRAIQAQLKVEGYNISLDGVWGNQSQKALRQAIDDKKYKVYFDFDTFKTLFKVNRLEQSFVDGVNGLYDAFNEFNHIDGTNPNYVAYLLASVKHETASTYLPLREYGRGKGRPYGSNIDIDGSRYHSLDHIYYGRGYIQLTWLSNYIKMGNLLGLDLVNRPDDAMIPSVAAKILVIGCLRGLFTGRGLSHYIKTGTKQEFINARRTVNGTDKASLIAGYALLFKECIILQKI